MMPANQTNEGEKLSNQLKVWMKHRPAKQYHMLVLLKPAVTGSKYDAPEGDELRALHEKIGRILGSEMNRIECRIMDGERTIHLHLIPKRRKLSRYRSTKALYFALNRAVPSDRYLVNRLITIKTPESLDTQVIDLRPDLARRMRMSEITHIAHPAHHSQLATASTH